jgi:hypothetical protein
MEMAKALSILAFWALFPWISVFTILLAYFFVVLGFELRTYTLSYSANPFL